ncbi:Uncharacterized protein APZ42_031123 [Daphnia magna]|uniref:Uncharacterized protein n=1 Tax=Daphnia magna TaxID=35525 RepID=A0A164N4T3_9CRUS|nr:Uncharacterized protein APZ42_031123 [Daphnia magna]
MPNHQSENSIFVDESFTPASVSENRTTVSCIFAIPLPDQISQKAAVTTTASKETKEQRIAVTFDHLGAHDDHPGSKHLDQVEPLYLIL